MKFFLFGLFWLAALLPARASHIVGGELLLRHISGNSYQVTLNMYFDNINGNRGAIDQRISLSIFEKGTDSRKMDFTMSDPDRFGVPYTSIFCTNSSLSTDKIVYTKSISLPEATFNSPQGYYMVWERCCRNRVISNIANPELAGQTFYLEFPPVVRNGLPFRNSSPQLFPPVSDYACVNELFSYQFSGQDPDGDSLYYEMVTPLNGNSRNGNAMPMPAPAPYALVEFSNGANANNQIPGNPTINISRRGGLLSMRPSFQGLFVFGVRCLEFRNGVQIGEVRRDFQILVLNCPKNDDPFIKVRLPGSTKIYKEGDVIEMESEGDRCLSIVATDPDTDEPVLVEARPVNFGLLDPLITTKTAILNRNGVKDSLLTSACFPGCFDTQGKIYQVDFVLSDGNCSLPQTSRVRVSFRITPRANARPLIAASTNTRIFKPRVGDELSFDIFGTDPDDDAVTLGLEAQNFTLSSQQIIFPGDFAVGRARSPFTWKIDCNTTSQASYKLKFKATTVVCGVRVVDTLLVEVQPQDSNVPPVITSPMAGKVIEVPFGTAFTDSVYATDADGNIIALTAAGEGYALAEYGLQFKPVSGAGEARSALTWAPTCNTRDRTEFKVNFMVKEKACRPIASESISVTFRIIFDATQSFRPADIFTPNQDGLNDFFQMPALPPDFCGSTFNGIQIFNRWGQSVYQSRDRNFKWDGGTLDDGVYFYLVTYSDKQFKGTVTKVR